MSALCKGLRSPFAAGVSASVLIFLCMMILRRSGSLESLELAAYDRFIRWHPGISAADPRIALIGITDQDIRNLGRWPIPDATLAQVLERLTQYQPRAIGVDLYRDVEVPPGREQLNAILTRNRHIVTVMKAGADGVPPPPVLEQTAQVGFSDILEDRDGIVRRGLLFVDDGGTSAYSLPLRLALLYLQAEGIRPQPDPSNPEHLRLGPTTIRPFEPNDGGYVAADARGYQFLLDFQGGRAPFTTFSLTALLDGDIDPQAITDKLVLIGATAKMARDFFFTPYSRGRQADQQVSGIGLHAHIASQLLRFTSRASSPRATLPDWQEGAWILLWSALGAAIGLLVRSPWRWVPAAASGLLLLGLVAYLLFVRGWWVPFVPPAMAWLGAGALVTAYPYESRKVETR